MSAGPGAPGAPRAADALDEETDEERATWVGRARRALGRRKLLAAIVVLAGGSAAAQAIGVVASPLLARIYTPAEFGVLAIYTSLLGTIGTATSLRYELAIPLPEDERTASSLLVLALSLVLIVSGIAGCVLWFVHQPILKWTHADALRPHLYLVPLGLIGGGVYQAFNYYGVRKRAYQRIARTRLTQSVGQVAAQVGLGLFGFGATGLLVGAAIGRMAGSLDLARYAWATDRENLRSVDRASVEAAARRYRSFPLVSTASTVLNATGIAIPAILVAGLYGAESAGHFLVAQRLAVLPMALIGMSVSQVYLAEFARLKTDRPSELLPLFRQFTRKLLLFGGTPIVLMALLGPIACQLVLGKAWLQAGLYVRVLAPMLVAQFVVSPISQTLNALERQRTQLVWDAFRLALVSAAFFVAKRAGCGPVASVGWYGAAMVAGYAVLYLIVRSILRRFAEQASVSAA